MSKSNSKEVGLKTTIMNGRPCYVTEEGWIIDAEDFDNASKEWVKGYLEETKKNRNLLIGLL